MGEAGPSPALSRNCNNGGQAARWSQNTRLLPAQTEPFADKG